MAIAGGICLLLGLVMLYGGSKSGGAGCLVGLVGLSVAAAGAGLLLAGLIAGLINQT